MSNGLARKSAAPAASSSLTVTWPESPLRMMTGIAAVAGPGGELAQDLLAAGAGEALDDQDVVLVVVDVQDGAVHGAVAGAARDGCAAWWWRAAAAESSIWPSSVRSSGLVR